MSRKQRLRKNELKIKMIEPEKYQIKNRGWIFFLITIVVLLVYTNSLNNAFVSDDIATIPENVNLTNLRANLIGFPSGFVYAVIRYLTALIAGDNPFLYRLINIIFHAGSANLLFVILGPMVGFGSALAVALIFGVHPLLTEGVTWISGAPYSAGTFFGLLAIYLYLKSQSAKRDWKSWLVYICALSYSQIAITIAPILAVYEITQGTLKKHWSRLIFYWSSGLFLTFIYLTGLLSARVSSIAQQNGGEFSRPNVFLQAIVAIGSYIQLFLWPEKLTLYHSEMTFTHWQVVWFSVIALSLLVLIIWGWRRDKRVSFWVLWFLLGISITLTPFGVNWIVAERYVYFGSIGLMVTTVLLYEKWIGRKVGKNISLIILTIILLGLGIRTIIRNREWKNQDTLWIATAKYSPASAQNHNNLGDLYARRKDFQKAIEEFTKAIEINPRYADAYHNLGNTYLSLGKMDQAELSYKKALEFNPKIWQSYAQLAAINANREDWNEAEKMILRGVSIIPNSNLWQILGEIYTHEGENEKAKEAFAEAERLKTTP